jgi:UDP-N-acetyl-2-amino-2-deoxyglucuronate dehydrogenase
VTVTRVGVIGAGVAAQWFVDLLRRRDDAACVSVLRSPGGDVAEASARLGVSVVDDPAAFYAARPEVVVVTTPSGLHARHAEGALDHGCHVLVEKPITTVARSGERLVDLAAARGVKLGVVFQRRADPVFAHVARTLADGALGKLVAVSLTLPYHRSAAYYRSAAWRGTWDLDGGGVLMNQGIHLLDVLVWWFGDPERVEAFATTAVHEIEVEDTLAAVLRFPGGALGTVLATTASLPGRPHSLEVLGSQGSLRLEGERIVRWDVQAPPPPETETEDGGATDPSATDTRNHARVIDDFLESVRSGRPPLVDGREGLRSVRLVEAIYAAAGLLGPSTSTARRSPRSALPR